MSIKNIFLWVCRLAAALILLQTLFFKFTASPESVYIFSQVHMEPWGRIGTGVLELIAAILLLIPRTSFYGAVIAAALMGGALCTHLFVIGIEVMNDNGLLFIYCLLVLFCALYIAWVSRARFIHLINKRKYAA